MGSWEDEFSFPLVGYFSSLESTHCTVLLAVLLFNLFFFRCKKIDSTYLKLCVWPSKSESKQTIIVTMSPQSHEKQQLCPPKNQLIYHKNRSTCRILVAHGTQYS